MTDWFVIHPSYIQLLGMGWIWVSFHCVPMCGPIVGSLGLCQNNYPSWKAAFFYQLGRGFVYSIFGFLSGWTGYSLAEGKNWWGWVMVAFLAVLFALQWMPLKTLSLPSWVLRLFSFIHQLKSSTLKAVLAGALLAFLPCMLSFWALGLAAQTKNPLQGAITMILLIGMTSLPIFISIKSFHHLRKWIPAAFERWIILVSLIWATLMTLAADEFIPHFHWMFKLGNQSFMLMFW